MCREVQQKAGKCTPCGDTQGWITKSRYIYGRWNGEYYLRPKNSDKVLDVSNNGNAIGTNVQIWDKNDTAAQRFSIYKHPKAGSSRADSFSGRFQYVFDFCHGRRQAIPQVIMSG